MARGYIYEISDDLDQFPLGLKESEFYEYINHEFNYVKTLGPDVWYKDSMAKEVFAQTGFRVTETGTDEAPCLKLEPEPDRMADYWRNRLQRAKKILEDMSSEDFRRSVETLQEAVDDTYGDMVCIDGSLITLDRFLRNAEEGRVYYLGGIFLAH